LLDLNIVVAQTIGCKTMGTIVCATQTGDHHLRKAYSFQNSK